MADSASVILSALVIAILLSTSPLIPMSAASAPTQNLTIPSGIVAVVPIAISNSQANPAPAPFQQLVTVDSASYSRYEAPNLQNIEFLYANGTVIPSWLESGSSSAATGSTYWLLLSGIPASSTITIYMGFASPSTNLFNGRTVGEAPELSPTYGEYDNGAKIFFAFYDNFAAGSSNSEWSVNLFGGAYARNNGLSVQPGSFKAYFVSSKTFGVGTSFDAWMTSLGDTGDVGYINTAQPALEDSLPGYVGWAGAFIRNGCYAIFPDQWNGTGEANTCGGPYGSFYRAEAPPSEPGVYTVSVLSSGSTLQFINYSEKSTTQPISSDYPPYPAPVGFQTGSLLSQWARVRTSPPNGIMPSALVMSVIDVSSTSANCASSTVVVGGSLICTAKVIGLSPAGSITWSSTGQGTFSPSACTLAAGTCSTAYTPTSVSLANVTASYSGDSNNTRSAASLSVVVTQAHSSVSVTCSPASVVVGTSTSCTATVAGYSPTGSITWSSTGQGTFSSSSCMLSAASCQVSYLPSSVNPFVPIDASYGGDSNNIGSSGSFSLTKATTTILVDCATNLVTVGSNSLCTATVSGNFGSLVGDTIFFASSGAGSFTPGATCTISSGTGCSDTYTPSSVGSGTHTITASFSGDGYNAGSSGSFSLSVSENYTILIVGVVVVVIIVAILAFVFWRRRGHRPTGPPSG